MKKNDEIIGILCIKIVENVLYLSRIGIKKNYRDGENGYHLHLFMIEKIVQELGIKAIMIEAHEGVFDWFIERGYLKIRCYLDTHWGKSATMLLLIG